MKDSWLYIVFKIINYTVLSIIALVCLLPLVHYIAQSFSSYSAVKANTVGLLPSGFQVEGYKQALQMGSFYQSLFVTFQRVILSSVLSLILIGTAAYALSKGDRLKGHKWYVTFFVIALLFNGGLIPSYILLKSLGLTDTIFALLVPNGVGPGIVNIFNMILLLNFFKSIPREIEEAAIMDGASHWRTFIQIYIPLSMPVIATVTLFQMVYDWNSWLDGAIYMSSENFPLGTLVYNILQQPAVDTSSMNNIADFYQPQHFKAPLVIISIIPIMLLYPFFQRFFVKGINLGGVKE